MTDSLSPTMPLTEARAQLFRLAEHVLSGAVDRVRLTHRSHPEDLLLVRASAVSQLEREITELRTRVAPDVLPLAGLGTLLLDDAQLIASLADSRAEAASAAERKQRKLAHGLAYLAPDKRLARVAEQVSEAPKGRLARTKRTPRG